jgi:thiamine biosynthesis lipoprotein
MCGCSNKKEKDEYSERTLFAMDTIMTLKAYGENSENAVEKAAEEIERLDSLLSAGRAESEIYQLNKWSLTQDKEGKARFLVSEDTFYLFKRALEINKMTEGAFDISIYPLMKLWGFAAENNEERSFYKPDEAEIEALLPLVSSSEIILDEENKEVGFGKPGMEVDFGGIAKGYASERVLEIFEECGVTSGIVNLGGNVQVLGEKPDGSAFRVAVEVPEDTSKNIGILSIRNKTVITSGGYERYFEEAGVKYHHILDPATGAPAENGLKSVTVVCEDGALADALSTALYVMGEEKAVEFSREHQGEIDVMLLTCEDELYITKGLEASYEADRYQASIIE